MMENAPSGPVAQDSTIMIGNSTGASAGASVTISAGSLTQTMESFSYQTP